MRCSGLKAEAGGTPALKGEPEREAKKKWSEKQEQGLGREDGDVGEVGLVGRCAENHIQGQE